MSLVYGDLWFETRLLMEATRIYDYNNIFNIKQEKRVICIQIILKKFITTGIYF